MTLALDIRLERGRFARTVQIESSARVIALTGPSGAGIEMRSEVSLRAARCASGSNGPRILATSGMSLS